MARTTSGAGSATASGTPPPPTSATPTPPALDACGHAAGLARQARTGSLATVCGLVLVLIAGLVGAGELHDNSFLTHLATGRWIIDGNVDQLWMGNADPYLATSGGRTWVVQSWLASVAYASAEHVAGAAGIRLLVAGVAMGLVAALWRLSAVAGGIVARVVAVGSVVAVGGTLWSERPLMFGLLFMAVALLAADGHISTRWLVVVGWLWVNTHGSFPLGIVALSTIAIGARLDGASTGRELRATRDLTIGCLLGGVLSPVGPVLLSFPVTLLRRQDVLSNVQEWQRTDFSQGWAQLFAVMGVLALLGLVRVRSYRSALPFLVFAVAGVFAARNVLVATVVLSPIIARGLAGIGSLGDRRSGALRLATIGLGVLAPVLVLSTSVQGDYRFDAYPVGAVDFLEERGLIGSPTVLTQDFTGNFLSWRYGPGVGAFIDDRYDLHDEALVTDYFVLHRGEPGWPEVLDDRGIEVVLWNAQAELSGLLATAPGWRLAYDGRATPATPATPAAGAPASGGPATDGLPTYVVYCRDQVARCFDTPAAR
jgi:hypothetical protein